jgi:hypothetical protein
MLLNFLFKFMTIITAKIMQKLTIQNYCMHNQRFINSKRMLKMVIKITYDIILKRSQMDILLILSDNNGHPNRELVDLLHREKSNLSDSLRNLEKEINFLREEWIYIFTYHFLNPANFVNKIRTSKDPVSSYIRRCTLNYSEDDIYFGTEIKPGCSTTEELAFDLQVLQKDASFYSSDRFAELDLRNSTKLLLDQEQQGLKLMLRNRQLLEDAYPENICKLRDSIVYRIERKTTNPASSQPNKMEDPYYITNNIHIFLTIIKNFAREIGNSEAELSRCSRYCEIEEQRQFLKVQHTEMLRSEIMKMKLYKSKDYNYYAGAYKEDCQRLLNFLKSNYAIGFYQNHGLERTYKVMCDLPDEIYTEIACWARQAQLIDEKEESDFLLHFRVKPQILSSNK